LSVRVSARKHGGRPRVGCYRNRLSRTQQSAPGTARCSVPLSRSATDVSPAAVAGQYNHLGIMKLLYSYLRSYWRLVALALVLATINQVFSLLDPLIFRHVIDQYATKHDQYTNGQFFRGVTLLLSMAVGVAFVSRVAKNFQDYFVNVVTQRLGA